MATGGVGVGVALNESFADGVRPWCLVWAGEDVDVFVGEDGAEAGGELGVAVSQEDLLGLALVSEIHDGVAGRLGGPRAGGVRGDSGQVGATGAIVDQDQGVEALEADGCP